MADAGSWVSARKQVPVPLSNSVSTIVQPGSELLTVTVPVGTPEVAGVTVAVIATACCPRR